MSSDVGGLASQDQFSTESEAWPVQPVAKWRENPQRIAWLILIASFTLFVILAVSIPVTIGYVVRYSTVIQPALLKPTLGTLLLYESPGAEPMAVTEPRDDITEGSRIVVADDSSQGTLGLVGAEGTDEVLGSVQLYPGAVLDVQRIRSPFFSRSQEPYRVRLRLEDGQTRIFTNSGDKRPLEVELETPHGTIDLDAGSYQVSVTDERTDLTVRSGQAQMERAGDGEIIVDQGLRAWMTSDELAQVPVPAGQNLLRNGDFSQPMQDTWQSYVVAENVEPGSVRIIEREGRRVAHFIRQGEEDVPTEVGITQSIEQDVNVFDSLSIQLDAKLLYQSLSGAGYLSSEFPLRVEITYTDIYGKELTWGHGFYFRDPENENWRIVNGEKIPPYIWYTYQSPNLMELLSDTRPARINSVRIYASGWNYQSMVSEAYLLVE
jgi:hypothetical protein